MAFFKPENITGLNNSHPLYSKINRFWEIGQIDKELITDTPISYSVSPTYADDPDLGDCRLFQAGDNSFITDFVPGNSGTLIVVWKINNNLGSSESPRVVNRASSGHVFQFGGSTFGSVNAFQFVYRGAFGTTITETSSPPFGDNAIWQLPHAMGARWNSTNGTGVTYDGNAVDSNTTATSNYSQTTELTMCDSLDLDGYIACVVWTDELTDQELSDITTDGNFYELLITDGAGVEVTIASTAKKPTVAASASATLPQPSASIAVSAKKPTIAMAASATLPQPSAAISSTAKKPVVAISASAALPQPSAAISFNAKKPTVAASASATLPSPSASIAVSAKKPTVSAVASATLPQPSSAVAASAKKPTVAISASATTSQPSANIAVTAKKPTVLANASATLPQPSAAVAVTAKKPTVSIAGAATLPSWSASIVVTAKKPTVLMSASATLPQPDASLSVTAKKPTVLISASISGSVLTPSDGGIINMQKPSTLINLQKPSRQIII